MDESKLSKAVDMLSQKSGADSERIKNAVKAQDMEALIKNLTPEQAGMLKKVLSDKKAAQELLSSPQAAALFKMIMGGK